MAEDLAQQIDQAFTELIGLLATFDQEELNTVPYEGSWTAGQLGRHMIKANAGFVQVMKGPVKDTDRNPGEMVKKIREDFLNFDIKLQSPEFIVPEKMDYNKEELLGSLRRIEVE